MVEETDIWTSGQLEKIKALRNSSDMERNKKRDDMRIRMEFNAKNDFKLRDKVNLTFDNKTNQKKGIVVKVWKNKKDGEQVFNVKFGKLLVEGIPAYYLRNASPAQKANLMEWVDDLSQYVKLTQKYQEMPTKKLLAMYKENRFNKEGIAMKHELSKREHVETRSEKGKKQTTIKWEEFLKQSKALSFR
jgi:hypothetical protein